MDLEKPPPSNDVAFGFKRGMCLDSNCDCDKFYYSDTGKCMNCGHFPTMHKNLGKPVLYSYDNQEEYRNLKDHISFEEQDVIITEHTEPLLVKCKPPSDKPFYLSSVKPSTKRRRGSGSKSSLLARTKNSSSSFRDVLDSIKSKDEETNLKKWAVKYRQSIELRALPVFGIQLEEVMARPNQNLAVPEFLHKITQYLETNGTYY